MSIPDDTALTVLIAYEDARWRGASRTEAMRAALTTVLPDLTAAAVAEERAACKRLLVQGTFNCSDPIEAENYNRVAMAIDARSNRP